MLTNGFWPIERKFPLLAETTIAYCRRCGAKVKFARLEKDGKQMPLDAEPSEDGNVVQLDSGEVRFVGKELARISRGQYRTPMFTSHLTTCPKARRIG